MTGQKKAYIKPELVIHGDIEALTQKGGGAKTDVPLGTAAGPSIGDVTGTAS